MKRLNALSAVNFIETLMVGSMDFISRDFGEEFERFSVART
jgi:hypothetical protein